MKGENMNDQQILSEINRTLEMESDSIIKLKENLDHVAILATLKAIAACKGTIVISGCGTSAMAAKKVVHSLNCIECPALFLTPSDAIHGGLGVLQKNDILILISKGGNTSELLKLVPACRAKGAALIVVTENLDSEIARAADILLKVKVEREPCRFNMLATASTLAVISTFDSICIALMQYKGYTREQFAVIHPGGAVGERLIEKIEISTN
jgi:KpsF/GutQ family protein